VIILTTFEIDEYIFGALRAGASGFLLKRSSPEQTDRRHPHRRGRRSAPLTLGHAALDRAGRRTPDPQPQNPTHVSSRLTTREREVLELIAQGLSNRGAHLGPHA
jgi:DNA-binding NarL/FixJ family response regulator